MNKSLLRYDHPGLWTFALALEVTRLRETNADPIHAKNIDTGETYAFSTFISTPVYVMPLTAGRRTEHSRWCPLTEDLAEKLMRYLVPDFDIEVFQLQQELQP